MDGINGGVAHDHEVHPKQPLDQDSVEHAARQRKCITQAAADFENVLPLIASSDQASTAALADDEPAMSGRQEALRLDEEIIQFPMARHDHVETTLKSFGTTTYVEPPTRFGFALQQAQHALLRAIMHHGVPPQPRSLPGKFSCSAVGFSLDGPPPMLLTVTALISWKPDWADLWSMVRVVGDVTMRPETNSNEFGRGEFGIN